MDSLRTIGPRWPTPPLPSSPSSSSASSSQAHAHSFCCLDDSALSEFSELSDTHFTHFQYLTHASFSHSQDQNTQLMPRRLKFPLLEAARLEEFRIRADGQFPPHLASPSHHMGLASNRYTGNCLFSAVADQLYADASRHAEIRAAAVAYEKANEAAIRPYVTTARSSDRLRGSKRKNNNPTVPADPTQAQLDAIWEYHTAELAKLSTWGGETEVLAISNHYRVHIQVHRAYEDTVTHYGEALDEGLPFIHIGFDRHAQHYSSLRAREAPHHGVFSPEYSISGTSDATDLNQQAAELAAAIVDSGSSQTAASSPASISRDSDSEDDEPISSNKRARISRASRMEDQEEKETAAARSITGSTDSQKSSALAVETVKIHGGSLTPGMEPSMMQSAGIRRSQRASSAS
jgi:hypothetical protein